MIERGRYNQTTKDNRHCPFCGSNLIEAFFFNVLRILWLAMNFTIKSRLWFQIIITQLPINGLINELMNSSNYFINIQFVKYISACFDVRDKLLSKQCNVFPSWRPTLMSPVHPRLFQKLFREVFGNAWILIFYLSMKAWEEKSLPKSCLYLGCFFLVFNEGKATKENMSIFWLIRPLSG